jgi:phenylpropionate dioxygenase-like ring-hydroxylating dioxygenase large terminal subunit
LSRDDRPVRFVCVDGVEEPLSEVAGAWPTLLDESGLDHEHLVLRERRTYEIKANWKIFAENFLECYHCPVSHHGFTALIELDRYEGQLHSDYFWHFASTTRDTAVAQNLHGIAELPRKRRDLWNFVLWPNFMANIYPGPGNISTNLLQPLAVDRTRVIYDFYFEQGVSDQQVRENVEFVDLVQQEDIALANPFSAASARASSSAAGSSHPKSLSTVSSGKLPAP